jgi:hypothetical protein
MRKILFTSSLLLFFIHSVSAETTGRGKVISTQGHIAPNCRTVEHRENETGEVRIFRILDVGANDGISSVATSALLENRDTTIAFEEEKTTGCGPEPRVVSIKIY